jgi:hypothetical protein
MKKRHHFENNGKGRDFFLPGVKHDKFSQTCPSGKFKNSHCKTSQTPPQKIPICP